MSKIHDVWVLTQSKNRPRIEAELSLQPLPTIHFLYFELPVIAKYVSTGDGTLKQLYYYLWHLAVYFIARKHHRRLRFDLCHHMTWSRYWMPNLLALLPIPFIWGPIGGGGSVPKAFRKELGLKGRWEEHLRGIFCWLGAHDPFLRLTAKNTAIGLSTTQSAVTRLYDIGIKEVEHFPYHVGISQQEFNHLSKFGYPEGVPIRFISLGRLVPWKGIHLSLHAFALAQLKGAEFFVVGDGADRKRLEHLAKRLQIAHSVKFLYGLSRFEAWEQLAQCHVLVHPCLRGSTTMACLEAMAAGRPLITLDFGQGHYAPTNPETGLIAYANSFDLSIKAIAAAMAQLAGDLTLCKRMGRAGRELVACTYLWSTTAERYSKHYQRTISAQLMRPDVVFQS